MLVELEIIKLDTAILALEKGFDCYGWSAYMYEAKYHEDSNEWELEDIKYMIPDKYWSDKLKLCPQALLQKWLREKQGLNIQILTFNNLNDCVKEISGYNVNVRKGYCFEIFENKSFGLTEFYNTYEEALESAINCCLSLI